MRTLYLSYPPSTSLEPSMLREFLREHGLEDGEILDINNEGNNTIIVVTVNGDSPSAPIKTVHGLLVAQTSLLDPPDTLLKNEREKRLSHHID